MSGFELLERVLLLALTLGDGLLHPYKHRKVNELS
jgi:hypothetical protein